MSFHLLVFLTHQGDIRELWIVPQIMVGATNILLEVIPPETELFKGEGHVYEGVGRILGAISEGSLCRRQFRSQMAPLITSGRLALSCNDPMTVTSEIEDTD